MKVEDDTVDFHHHMATTSPPAMLRVPPSSPEAEQSILGGLMLDNRLIDLIGDMLGEADFFRHEHRVIWSACVQQLMAGLPADTVTVWERIKGQGKANEVALEYLHELTQYVPSAANIRRYAEIVRDRALSRRMVAAGDEIASMGFNTDTSFAERVDLATAKLAELVGSTPKDEWVSASDGMAHHMSVLTDRTEGRLMAWPTGLHDIDDVLEGGFRPGELIVVGARPSMGKTALALSIGVHMARQVTVGMFSMEMPHHELNDRLTAMLGHVNLGSVKRPSKGEGLEWGKVTDGVERARSLRWFATDKGGLNISQVRSKARQLKRQHGLSVLIVDYIGLMTGTDQKQPRAYQLEEVSRGLKTLAKELEIAVLCLAQVNRKVEDRTDHTPSLSDLRDSGAIEQDADVVMFLHRPVQSNPSLNGDWERYAKLTVAKNRQGRSGVPIHLMYLGDQTRFASWSGPAPVVKTVGEKSSTKGFQHED